MNPYDIFKTLFGGLDRYQRNFVLNRTGKHSNAKQPKRDAEKRDKIRRRMAKQSRKINRRK